MVADWLIEPRSLAGVRYTDPLARWTSLATVDRYNVVGTWSVTGALDAVRPLLVPGGGVVISRDGRQVMSGPATQLARRGDRTVTVTGRSDDVRLADRLALPNPAQPITAQTTDADVRTGPRESVILAYINANAGPGAVPSRRTARLRMPTSASRGGTVKQTARLDNLLALVGQIAEAGRLRVQVVHAEDGDGPWLDVVITEVGDKSAFVRFGPPESGGPGRLDSDWTYTLNAPTVTETIVAGGGEGAARIFAVVGDSAAESLWGRRVEQLVDQRQTADTDELVQAGVDALASGAAPAEFSGTVIDTPDLGYRTDWTCGDIAAVTVDGIDVVDVIREVTTTVTRDGGGAPSEAVQPTLGSQADASQHTTPSQRLLADGLRRLAALERRL